MDKKEHDFRNDDKRAFSHEGNRPQSYPQSYFEKRVKPGDTIWGFMFPRSGMIKDLVISVGYLDIDMMPVNVEISKGTKGVLEINKILSVGDNEFTNHSVDKGDKITFKARDLDETQFSARDIYISFNLVTGKNNG